MRVMDPAEKRAIGVPLAALAVLSKGLNQSAEQVEPKKSR